MQWQLKSSMHAFRKLLGGVDAYPNLRAQDCKITHFSEPKNSSSFEFFPSSRPASVLTSDFHTISGIWAAKLFTSLSLLPTVSSRPAQEDRPTPYPYTLKSSFSKWMVGKKI